MHCLFCGSCALGFLSAYMSVSTFSQMENLVLSAVIDGEKKYAPPFDTTAPIAFMQDMNSGAILYSKQPDFQMPPASLAKLMTMEVVFHALRVGRLTMDDKFAVSKNAWTKGGAKSGGSTMFAKVNSEIRVEDLIKASLHNGDPTTPLVTTIFPRHGRAPRLRRTLLAPRLRPSAAQSSSGKGRQVSRPRQTPRQRRLHSMQMRRRHRPSQIRSPRLERSGSAMSSLPFANAISRPPRPRREAAQIKPPWMPSRTMTPRWSKL